jgi:hypothetical protein
MDDFIFNLFDQFAHRLSDTRLALLFQDTLWVVPVAQSVHILAVTVIVGSAFMIDLRILNLAGRSQNLAAVAARFTPWLWAGLGVALATGGVMVIAEPVRTLVNPAFWGKMGLLLISLASTFLFQLSLQRQAGLWETTSRSALAKSLALVSLVIWCAIVVLGRAIAYDQIET